MCMPGVCDSKMCPKLVITRARLGAMRNQNTVKLASQGPYLGPQTVSSILLHVRDILTIAKYVKKWLRTAD